MSNTAPHLGVELGFVVEIRALPIIGCRVGASRCLPAYRFLRFFESRLMFSRARRETDSATIWSQGRLVAERALPRNREEGRRSLLQFVERALEATGVRRSALASVSNHSAISSKPSSRAERAMPGYISYIHGSRQRRRPSDCRRSCRSQAGGRISNRLKKFEMAVRVAGLAFRGGAEQRRRRR